MLSTQKIIDLQSKCESAAAAGSSKNTPSTHELLEAVIQLSEEVVTGRSQTERSELLHAAQCDRSFIEGAQFGWSHATAKNAKKFNKQIESMEAQIADARKELATEGYTQASTAGFNKDLKVLAMQCRDQLLKSNTAHALIMIRAIIDQLRSPASEPNSGDDGQWAKKLAWELEGIHADVTTPHGSGFDAVCLNTLNRVMNALYAHAKKTKGNDTMNSDDKKTITRTLSSSEHRAIATIVGEEAAKSFVRVVAFNDRPETKETTNNDTPDTWRELFFSLAQELGCLPSTYASGNQHVIRKAHTLMEESKNSIPLQDAWVAAGGNPEIKATREDLVEALKMLDQICDEADGDAPKFIPMRKYADLFTVAQWKEVTKSNAIIAGDGSGYWAKGELMQSNISAFTPQPEWATHVAWFNK